MKQLGYTTRIILMASLWLSFPAVGFGKASSDELREAIKGLESTDPEVRYRSITNLGFIGAEMRRIQKALVFELKVNRDEPPVFHDRVAFAMDFIGAGSERIYDSDVARAQFAVGRMSETLKEIEIKLIDILNNTEVGTDKPLEQLRKIRSRAAFALGTMSAKTPEARLALEAAKKNSSSSPDVYSSALYSLDRIEAEAKSELTSQPKLGDIIGEWIVTYPSVKAMIAVLLLLLVVWLLLLVVWLLMFWLRPRWFLPISEFLSRCEPNIRLYAIEGKLPSRHLLLVRLFDFRERVLDSWVLANLEKGKDRFATKPTVRQRATYVPMPAMLNDERCEIISSSELQPIFDKSQVTVLIKGEGGAGKTSLICQIAFWAMSDKPDERLCKNHRMLPVLIEGNIEQGEKSALTEAIRGHLRELIGETVPEELLLHLLRKRRVLVIVDNLSELDAATRKMITPAKTGFPVNALIVTSRLDEMKTAAKTIIEPVRLQRSHILDFMREYLIQRCKWDSFPKDKFSESYDHLSQIVGDRDITPLIAKLYAELVIANQEKSSRSNLPRNLPELMLGYVANIQGSVKADGEDSLEIKRAAKILAWECLKGTCRPSRAKEADILKALKKDGAALLKHLKHLQLVQTGGSRGDLIYFSLDPLAEYLASLHLVELYGRQGRKWQEIFDIINSQPGMPETIRGFLLALRDCCEHYGKEHEVPEWVSEKLSVILAPSPESVTGKQPWFV